MSTRNDSSESDTLKPIRHNLVELIRHLLVWPMRRRNLGSLMVCEKARFVDSLSESYPISNWIAGRAQCEGRLTKRKVSLCNTKIERDLSVERLVAVVGVVEALLLVRVHHVILDDLRHNTTSWDLFQVFGSKVGVPRSEEVGGRCQEVCGDATFGSLGARADGFAYIGIHFLSCKVRVVSNVHLVAEVGVNAGENCVGQERSHWCNVLQLLLAQFQW